MGRDDYSMSNAIAPQLPPLEKDWKYYLGVGLFIFSWLTFAVTLLTPFMPVSKATAAVLVTALIIAGEVTFWASIALLGKPFMQLLKTKLIAFLHSRKPAELRHVSKRRHDVGLALFFCSFLSYYLALAVAFLELPRDQMLNAIINILIIGQATFFVSLFVLGGEFWAKLKRLFQWPGMSMREPRR
jgi:hypothetical protein